MDNEIQDTIYRCTRCENELDPWLWCQTCEGDEQMSKEAMLPCFKCGKTLQNVSQFDENQPYEGTEFRTYGHYGSTFWDSFDGEQLVLNVCDKCLTDYRVRLAQHKRYLPIHAEGFSGMGRQWVDRPMVPYTGHTDDGKIVLDVEELGTNLPNVEWPSDIQERKQALMEEIYGKAAQ